MSALYDDIGATYSVSRRADPALARALARELRLSPAGAYLDIGCGTGNYTVALSSVGGAWCGVDASGIMLAQARSKPSSVAWVQADAGRLPFCDAAFDGALCTLAIHHFKSLDVPFAQARRVLRRGPLVIFTGLAEQMQHYWLCHYFPEMMVRSIEKMPSESSIRAALSRAGFQRTTMVPFFVDNELQDLFLYCGKHRPAVYLDPAVRANISSFAQLARPAQVQQGLARLNADVRSGAFESIKSRYRSQTGDYAFVVAR